MILLASIAISKLVGLLTNDRKINLKEDPTAKTGKPIDILDIPRNTTHATRNNTTTEYPQNTAFDLFCCTSMPMKSIFAYSILFLTILLNCKIVEGKQNEGYDLDSDAPIRIGVKNRIKDKDCK